MCNGNRHRLRLGLPANAGQFTLLVAVNALVGGLLSTERTVLPLLGVSADSAGGVGLPGGLPDLAPHVVPDSVDRFAGTETGSRFKPGTGPSPSGPETEA